MIDVPSTSPSPYHAVQPGVPTSLLVVVSTYIYILEVKWWEYGITYLFHVETQSPIVISFHAWFYPISALPRTFGLLRMQCVRASVLR